MKQDGGVMLDDVSLEPITANFGYDFLLLLPSSIFPPNAFFAGNERMAGESTSHMHYARSIGNLCTAFKLSFPLQTN